MESVDFDAMIMEAERLVLERVAPEDRAWAINRLSDAYWRSGRTSLPIEGIVRQARSQARGFRLHSPDSR